MTGQKDFPGTLIKRGKIFHYQLYIPGKGYWMRTTRESVHRKAIAVARKLYAQAMLLSESRGELPTLSKAIVREVERISRESSERQAERVGFGMANFLAWADDLQLERITTSLLAKYQDYRSKCKKMVNKGKKRVPAKSGNTVSPSTIKREIQSILRLLKENGYEVKPPITLKGDGHLGRPFSRDELKRFFEASNKFPADEPGRYTPLFLMMLATGARPAELIPSERSSHVALLKKEIDPETCTVTIRSAKVRKGSRSRITRLQVAKPVIETVLTQAKKLPGSHPFPPMTLNHVFNKILAKAGIPQIDELGEKLTAHSFRHTFGTMLAEQGANAFIIQNVMRHANPSMTSRYTERATAPTLIDVSQYMEKSEGGEG